MNYVILEEYPHYEIYEDGEVIRIEKLSKNGKALQRRVITPTRAKNGYRTVRLYNKDGVMKQFYLHRLIWEAFNGEIPEGYEVDHLIDRDNNDLNHLRVVSHKENCNNPRSLERYRRANALSAGKFDRDRLMNAQTEEYYQKLIGTYQRLAKEQGQCGIWLLMKIGHCGYPRAKRIIEEMKGGTGINQ